MDRKQLLDFLQQSFEDERVSRNEASVFKELLEEAGADHDDLSWVRSEIFNIAEDVMKHPDDKKALRWVESLVKVVLAKGTGGAPVEKNEALFFPNEQNLYSILDGLKATRSTMDICVFTITDNRITSAILDAHKRGVKVRVITDDEKSLDLGSDIAEIRDAGIPLRFDNNPGHMHNKFAVLDGLLLLNGSFNWTRSASRNNHENIQITSNAKMIDAFSREFNKLWKEFGGE